MVSLTELTLPEASHEIVPATYDAKRLAEVAMICAARPIEYKKVTMQFSEHTSMKIVEMK